MQQLPAHRPWHRVLAVSEALRAELGTPTVISRLTSSPRSRVWLVEFDGSPAIVKQIVAGPDANDRYSREVAALRLAAHVRPPVAASLLATDPSARVLVLEYLTSRNPDGGEWVIDYATALARLHAATGPADVDELPAWTGPSPADIQAFLELAGQLQVPILHRVPDELHRLLDRIDPAGGHALLHGDPCPDNALHTHDGVRFVDLEQAALGHGPIELAYLRIGFPTCWCVTAFPTTSLTEAETAYRTTWRSITHTDPPNDLADACASWLIRGDALVERAKRGPTDHLVRLHREDWSWGTATARERLLHRLTVVTTTTAERDDLAGLAQLCHAMHDRILQLWPALNPLPVTTSNPIHNS
jgi:fructosamine-3-kinase